MKVSSITNIITNSSSVEYCISTAASINSCKEFLKEILDHFNISGKVEEYFEFWEVPYEIPGVFQRFAEKHSEILPDFSNFDKVCEDTGDHILVKDFIKDPDFTTLDLDEDRDMDSFVTYRDLLWMNCELSNEEGCEDTEGLELSDYLKCLYTTLDIRLKNGKKLPQFYTLFELGTREW